MPTPLILKIDVDDKGQVKVDKFYKSMKDVENQTKKSSASLKTFVNRLNSTKYTLDGVIGKFINLKTAIVGLGLGLLIKNTISVAAHFEQMQVALDTITKGKGVETFKKLNEFALRMPGSTEAIINTYVKLRAMGLEPTIKEMEIMIDTMMAMGGTPDILDSIGLALGKIAAKGKASARDLLMLTQRGIPAIEILRKELGDASLGFETISKSGRRADEIIQALLTGMEKRFGGMAKKSQELWSGQMEILRSEIKEFQRMMMMEGGVLPALTAGIRAVNDAIEDLRKAGKLDVWASDMAITFLEAIKGMIGGIQELLTVLGYVLERFNLLKQEWLGFKIVSTEKAIKELEKITTKPKVAGKAFMMDQLLGKDPFAAAEKDRAELERLRRVLASLREELDNAGDANARLNRTFETSYGIIEDLKSGIEKMIKDKDENTNADKKTISSAKDTNKVIEELSSKQEKLQVDLLKAEEDRMKKSFAGRVELLKKWYDEQLDAAEGNEELIERLRKEYHLRAVDLIEEQREIYEKAEKKKTKTTKEELSKIGQLWKEGWTNIENHFVYGFANMLHRGVNSFREFASTIQYMFNDMLARMTAEAIARPIITPIVAGAAGITQQMGAQMAGMGIGKLTLGGLGGKIGGFLGSPVPGFGTTGAPLVTGEAAAFGPTWGGALGAAGLGSLGYGTIGSLIGLPQGEYTPYTSGLGAGLGFVLGGPIGAILGSIGGGLLGSLFGKKKQPRPDIVLKWEIDEEGFRQVTDYWAGGAQKNIELLDAINGTIGNLTNLYSDIAKYTNTVLQDVEITIDFLGARVSEITLETQRVGFKFAEANIKALQKLFGDYLPTELIDEITKLEEARQALIAGGVQQFYTAGGGGLPFLKTAKATKTYNQMLSELEQTQTELLENFNEHMDALFARFSAVAQSFSELIGGAFRNSLLTSDFAVFKAEFKRMLYQSFATSLESAFVDRMTAMVMPAMFKGTENFETLIAALVSGAAVGTTTPFITYGVQDTLEQLVENIEALGPAFEAMSLIMEKLREALDANTQATEKIESIETFISQLTTGPLSPVQSYALIRSRYEELLGGGSPLSELFSYIQSTYLPFMQAYGQDYSQVFQSVVSDLQSIIEMEQSNQMLSVLENIEKNTADTVAALYEGPKIPGFPGGLGETEAEWLKSMWTALTVPREDLTAKQFQRYLEYPWMDISRTGMISAGDAMTALKAGFAELARDILAVSVGKEPSREYQPIKIVLELDGQVLSEAIIDQANSNPELAATLA